MKRSAAIKLVFIGSSLVLLSACDQSPSSPLGTDQSYSTKEDCEKVHGSGKCDIKPREGGGSVFMPMMAGYMLGSMLNQPKPHPERAASPNDVKRGGFGGQARHYHSAGG